MVAISLAKLNHTTNKPSQLKYNLSSKGKTKALIIFVYDHLHKHIQLTPFNGNLIHFVSHFLFGVSTKKVNLNNAKIINKRTLTKGQHRDPVYITFSHV